MKGLDCYLFIRGLLYTINPFGINRKQQMLWRRNNKTKHLESSEGCIYSLLPKPHSAQRLFLPRTAASSQRVPQPGCCPRTHAPSRLLSPAAAVENPSELAVRVHTPAVPLRIAGAASPARLFFVLTDLRTALARSWELCSSLPRDSAGRVPAFPGTGRSLGAQGSSGTALGCRLRAGRLSSGAPLDERWRAPWWLWGLGGWQHQRSTVIVLPN